jgi:hypothetical protein
VGLAARFDGSCVVEIYKAVFVIVFVDDGSHSGNRRLAERLSVIRL